MAPCGSATDAFLVGRPKGKIGDRRTDAGAGSTLWEKRPRMVFRVIPHPSATDPIKNARGHAFYRCGEGILITPDYVGRLLCRWFQISHTNA